MYVGTASALDFEYFVGQLFTEARRCSEGRGTLYIYFHVTFFFFYYVWLDVCMMYEPYARFKSELVVMMLISISISYTTANVRLILTI